MRAYFNHWDNIQVGDIVLGWRDEDSSRPFLILKKQYMLLGVVIEFKMRDLVSNRVCKVRCMCTTYESGSFFCIKAIRPDKTNTGVVKMYIQEYENYYDYKLMRM